MAATGESKVDMQLPLPIPSYEGKPLQKLRGSVAAVAVGNTGSEGDVLSSPTLELYSISTDEIRSGTELVLA